MNSGGHPVWLRKKLPGAGVLAGMKGLLDGLGLHTVCEAAGCPNQGECFASGTATFLIMGDTCTRDCRFCGISGGTPTPLDPEEPRNVARAAALLELSYVVITSVTRDDLTDGGARHFANTVKSVREACPGSGIEILVPDFQGSHKAVETVIRSGPQVFNHNVETVPSLYQAVRPGAGYDRSLDVLRTARSLDPGILAKSGLMVGLGETREEVIRVMKDLRAAGCDLLTIGQYLAPSRDHYPVARYVSPEEFKRYGETGKELGFREVASGPFVRSSFRAGKFFENLRAAGL